MAIEKDENKQTKNNRREFLGSTAKKALWVAPTMTLLMAASGQPAKACCGYGSDGPA